MTNQDRAAIAQNITNCMATTVKHLQELDKKTGLEGMHVRQIALLTIAVLALGQIQLAMAPEQMLVSPN